MGGTALLWPISNLDDITFAAIYYWATEVVWWFSITGFWLPILLWIISLALAEETFSGNWLWNFMVEILLGAL